MSRAATLTVFLLCLTVYAQQPIRKANLLIEAFATSSPSGPYRYPRLWIRLKNDGAVEWEEPVWGKPNELHSSSIPRTRVEAIAKELTSVDWSKSVGELGPYYRYVDTVLELRIRIPGDTGEHTFTVINPWPHWEPLKPMPNDVRRTICNLQILRAQVSDEKILPLCEGTLHELQCTEGSKSCVKP